MASNRSRSMTTWRYHLILKELSTHFTDIWQPLIWSLRRSKQESQLRTKGFKLWGTQARCQLLKMAHTCWSAFRGSALDWLHGKSCRRHHAPHYQLCLGLQVQHLPIRAWSRDLAFSPNLEPCLQMLLMEDCTHKPTNNDNTAQKSVTFCMANSKGTG